MIRIKQASETEVVILFAVQFPLIMFCYLLIWSGIDYLLRTSIGTVDVAWWLADPLGIAAFIGTIVLWNKLTGKFFRILTSYCYLHRALKTPATWKDAEKVAPLFILTADEKWYPLKEVKKLPKNKRMEYVYTIAQKAGRYDWNLKSGS